MHNCLKQFYSRSSYKLTLIMIKPGILIHLYDYSLIKHRILNCSNFLIFLAPGLKKQQAKNKKKTSPNCLDKTPPTNSNYKSPT